MGHYRKSVEEIIAGMQAALKEGNMDNINNLLSVVIEKVKEYKEWLKREHGKEIPNILDIRMDNDIDSIRIFLDKIGKEEDEEKKEELKKELKAWIKSLYLGLIKVVKVDK